MESAPDPAQTVLAYHQRTKHQPGRFARSLGFMDWETQPDLFRCYEGAPAVPLDVVPPAEEPSLDQLYQPCQLPARPVDHASLSQLLFDSLALSAWKELSGGRWSLRCVPSSGNLHPIEGYLICGPVDQLCDDAALHHYDPRRHALEQLAPLTAEHWTALVDGLPAGVLLLGLTSILWRESWKYGERAFRYCQLDAGHALAGLAYAAAALGWQARLLDGVTHQQAGRLLGVARQQGAEAEHPDALLALYPAQVEYHPMALRRWRPPGEVLDALDSAQLAGQPSQLSEAHHRWPVIEEVAAACRSDAPAGEIAWCPGCDVITPPPRLPCSARHIMRKRRSAVALDSSARLDAEAFYSLLSRLLPRRGAAPLATLPWRPGVHLVLFVHGVKGLAPGIYALPRVAQEQPAMRAAMRPDFLWRAPPGCPEGLPLYLLADGDSRAAAEGVSCAQAIAGDGVFAASMLAELEPRLTSSGPQAYRWLHWEAGAVGQLLYLEAEAVGLRGTGIGCYFDDEMHNMLGIGSSRYQAIYHFTVGSPVDDSRIKEAPAYPRRTRAAAGQGAADQGRRTQRTLPSPSSALKPTTPSSNMPPPWKRTTQ